MSTALVTIKSSTPAHVTVVLDEHADRIRGFLVGMAKDSLALGRELVKANAYWKSLPKKARPSAVWEEWLQTEFKISGTWARTLMRASKNVTSVNKHIAPRVIALISSTSSKAIPTAAITEIKQRIKKGEKVSVGRAIKIARKHKTIDADAAPTLPTPSEAKNIASKTGTLVAASDGRLYTGASDEAVQEYASKRTVVYSVRRALDTLATVGMSAAEFLKYIEPHQEWTIDEQHVIADACKWIVDLDQEWRLRVRS